MCRLCSEDRAEAREARQYYARFAERFEQSARDLRRVAESKMTPHGAEFVAITERIVKLGVDIIREWTQ